MAAWPPAATAWPPTSAPWPPTPGTWPSSGTVTSASDNFNRANGALGANWAATSDLALTVVSNEAKAGTNAQYSSLWSANSFTNNQFSEVQVGSVSPSPGDWIGAMIRADGAAQNGYVAIYFNNAGTLQVILYGRSAGSFSQLGTTYASGTLAQGTPLRLSASGTTVSVLVAGVTQISVTDSARASGAVGIAGFGTTAVCDNWSGGNA